MATLKVRKNFIFDKEIVDQTSAILKKYNKSFTEAINLYFQAITKDPSTIEQMEKNANKRVGNFIGILDKKIGNMDFKDMKKYKNEVIS